VEQWLTLNKLKDGEGKMKGTSLNLKMRSISFALCLLASIVSVNAYGQGASGEATKKPSKSPAPRTTSPKPSKPSKKNTTSAKAGRSNTSRPVDNSKTVEIAYWDSIKNSTNPEDFKSYLKKYPGGEFADSARNKITSLEIAAKEKAERERKPSRFLIDYKGEPEPGKRYWSRADEFTWIERYPSGIVTVQKIIGPMTVEGDSGTVVGSEIFQVFIPDKGSKWMWLRFRHNIQGSWQAWNYLGEMKDIQ
jgi:hypothetical protein